MSSLFLKSKGMKILVVTALFCMMFYSFGTWVNVKKTEAAAAPALHYKVNRAFNGTSDYIDKSADIQEVSGLKQGSIVAQFKTMSTGVAKTIISASDGKDPSSNLTLSVNGAALHFENRENGTYATNITVYGNYNDGKRHTIVITVDASGTKFYVDGHLMASNPSKAFFSFVKNINNMDIGRNVDSGGGQWYYSGHIKYVSVYNRALTSGEAEKISGHTGDPNGGIIHPSTITLFKAGTGGSADYRIPSMITTEKGTLLAVADARRMSNADSPNNIDKVIRRSKDNGTTWSDPKIILNYPGKGRNGASTIDAAMLQDKDTGTIWLLTDQFPGGVGFPNARQGTGFDQQGHRLLYDKQHNVYKLRKNGKVYTASGKKTNYTVAENGDVFLNGEKQGNMYLKMGKGTDKNLYEARTAFLTLIKSEDDGKTWSAPIDLNAQVKSPWMKFIGVGPGRGIQMKDGRLVFPIYYTNANGMQSSAVIYSDDHGKTWERGKSPNDGRSWNGTTLHSKTLDVSKAQLTESQVVQLTNGNLRIYMRNPSGKSRVAVAESKNGGESWGPVSYNKTLVGPYCQLSVIRYTGAVKGKQRLIFSNPSSPRYRVNGTIRLSQNDGQTWKYSKVIQPGNYAYSSLTELPNGEIGVLYEHDTGSISFTKFPLSALTQ